jgi:adenylate cyclase class 2
MIEVEIRAKIKNLAFIKRKIKDLGGKYIKTEKQVDKIFGRKKYLDKDHKIIEGHFSARVRQTGNNISVELKEIRRTGAGLEFSSKVSTIDQGVYFLSKLDFKEAFTISKNRDIHKYKNFEISLDKIDKLGSFIEIEHWQKTGSDKEKAIKECIDLLNKIDPKVKIETKKYGDMMQELINGKNS